MNGLKQMMMLARKTGRTAPRAISAPAIVLPHAGADSGRDFECAFDLVRGKDPAATSSPFRRSSVTRLPRS